MSAAPGSPPLDPAATSSSTELEVYKAVRAHELMLNQATAAFEHAAIAPLLLINGGGAVAFLTLLGATTDPTKSQVSISTGWAVGATIAWSAGLIAAALATTFGLGAQRGYSRAHRLHREVVEQALLGSAPLAKAVAPAGYAAAVWDHRREAETEAAKRLSQRYRNARWASIGCFIAGAACAALSVL